VRTDGDHAALERIVAGLVDRLERRFYGKYRGTVVDNNDPAGLGRLKVTVPSVLGPDVVTGWATPCTPYGGAADEGFLFVPAPGAGVWVEFEEGDLEFPIWVGTYWTRDGGDSQLPKPQDAAGAEQDRPDGPPTRKIIKTRKGHTIQLEDADSEELVTIVEAVNHNVITLNSDGITVTDGNGNQLAMTSDGVVLRSSGTQITVGGSGVQVGGDGATEPLVLGNQLATQIQSFLTSLMTHQHLGNLGAPTGPPMAPLTLTVPLSQKHTVE
jgi:uncharacterized protein involved in type VI secretion and phage assembly